MKKRLFLADLFPVYSPLIAGAPPPHFQIPLFRNARPARPPETALINICGSPLSFLPCLLRAWGMPLASAVSGGRFRLMGALGGGRRAPSGRLCIAQLGARFGHGRRFIAYARFAQGMGMPSMSVISGAADGGGVAGG